MREGAFATRVPHHVSRGLRSRGLGDLSNTLARAMGLGDPNSTRARAKIVCALPILVGRVIQNCCGMLERLRHERFEVGSICGHSGVILKQRWDHVRMILGSCLYRVQWVLNAPRMQPCEYERPNETD